MSFSSNRETYIFSRHVGASLHDIGFQQVEEDRPERLLSLKELMTSQNVGISISTASRFQIEMRPREYCEALHKDLYFGLNRIGRLRHALRHLNASSCTSAWQVTTCYYASFFAATELLRTSGTYISYLDTETAQRVASLGSPPGRIDEGTYEGVATFDQLVPCIRIQYSKRKVTHHKFTWQKISDFTKGIVKGGGASERRLSETFLTLIGTAQGSAWELPSDTRNTWNYAQSDLFSKKGEQHAEEFRKLCCADSAALNWAKTLRHCNSSSEATAMGFFNSFLSCILADVSSLVFSKTKIKPNELIQLG
jgi:hypothetical protein